MTWGLIGLYDDSTLDVSLAVGSMRIDNTSTPVPSGLKQADNCSTHVIKSYGKWIASGTANATGAGIWYYGNTKDRLVNDVCLNHLFTHYDCKGTLGVANTGEMCRVGLRSDMSAATNVGYTSYDTSATFSLFFHTATRMQ